MSSAFWLQYRRLVPILPKIISWSHQLEQWDRWERVANCGKLLYRGTECVDRSLHHFSPDTRPVEVHDSVDARLSISHQNLVMHRIHGAPLLRKSFHPATRQRLLR